MKRILLVVLVAFTALVAFPARSACCSTFSIFPDTTRQFSSSVLIPPTYTDALVLAANTSQTQAVPAGANWVVFSGACNFFVKDGASASVPGSSTTDGSAPMQNPAAWNLTGKTQFTVVAASTCIVTLSFYS